MIAAAMVASVFIRRLREGATFEDFIREWEADQGFGVPTRVINAPSLQDPRDIISIGFIDVSANGRGIRVSDKGIHAQHLDLEATLPWAVAATQVGEGVELYAAGSGRAGISRTIEVLGQRVPVKATGTVRADNGELVIEPESVDLDGPDWLDTVASAAARALVTIRQPVQGVPDGLRLTGVSVIDTGFRATLSGDGVTITN